MIDKVLKIASVPELQASKVDVVFPEGSYLRHPMFQTDITELDGGQRALFAAYTTSLKQQYGPIQRLILNGAVVTGQGAVVSSIGTLIRESVLEFLAHQAVPDGFMMEPDGSLCMIGCSSRRIEQPTLLLQRPWYMNFGHWIVDSATMLSVVSRLAMPKGWQIVVGAQTSEALRAIVFETIGMLCPGIPVLERPQADAWEFAQLHYVTPVHVPPLFKHPEGLAYLRAAVLQQNPSVPGGTRRLFISRGPTASRLLINEPEVIGLLCGRGFEVIEQSSISLRGQAEIFQSARIVIGVKGAALTNAVFCASGSHLVALSPGDFPDPFFWDLVTQSGVNYSEIFGSLASHELPQSHNGFTIDLPRLAAIVDRIDQTNS